MTGMGDMTQFDDLARRAARAVDAEAAAMVPVDDALQAVRAAREALVLELDPQPTPSGRAVADRPRTAWKALAGIAAAGLAVVGVGVVFSGGDDESLTTEGTSSTTDPSRSSTDESESTVAPIPVGDGDIDLDLPDGWAADDPYYLGSGLTLMAKPSTLTRSAEEVGYVERQSIGQLTRTEGVLEARTYVTTITDTDSASRITIGLAAGDEPPRSVPEGDESAVVRRDGYTIVVSTSGLRTRGVAQQMATTLRFDSERVLDRFDVDGGFDSVLQRGGYASSGAWILYQGERTDTRHCLRLVVTDSDVPGGWNFCFDTGADERAYARIGERHFVVGLRSPEGGARDPVVLRGGKLLDVFDTSTVGPVLQELPVGAEIDRLSAEQPRGCPLHELAEPFQIFPAVVLQIVQCDEDGALVRSPASSPAYVANETFIARDGDGEWQNPFTLPVALGAGLRADFLPDEYRRSGDLLGGPFTMDAGGSQLSHAVTITTGGFRRPTSIQIGYVFDGEPGAAFAGETVAARRSADATLWAASDDHDRGELQEIVDGLRLDLDSGADDGEPGEFGSIIAGGPAARGWTEWTLAQSFDDGFSSCIVLSEKVFGRPPPDAIDMCVPTGAPQATTIVIRGANTYVIGLGREGVDAAGAVVTLDDGTQLQPEEVRSVDDGGQVFVTVVPAASRIADVSWTEELGRACTFGEMWDRLDWIDDFETVAVQVMGCELWQAAAVGPPRD
jgi:hypothetical protein